MIYKTGMWGQWQGNATAEGSATTTPNNNHPTSHGNSSVVPHPTGPHQPQQELSDMLQMLGQSEPTSFEDLSMFNSFTE
mgnify:CR=1 FL=1